MKKKEINVGKNEWREVSKGIAEYGVILRAQSYDTSVFFYDSKEDLEWAMKESWFDNREAIPFKLLKTNIVIQ